MHWLSAPSLVGRHCLHELLQPVASRGMAVNEACPSFHAALAAAAEARSLPGLPALGCAMLLGSNVVSTSLAYHFALKRSSMLSFPAGISSLQLSDGAVRYSQCSCKQCPDKEHMRECCSLTPTAKAEPDKSVRHLEAYNCHLGSFSKSKALQGKYAQLWLRMHR